MATEYDLTGDRAIEQGASWQKLSLFFPENLSTARIKGQIRSDFLAKGGVLYAEFGFAPPIYGSVLLPNGTTPVLRTAIVPSLTAVQTRSIPLTIGKLWTYDIFAELADRTIKIAYGKVDVLPTVTEL